MIEASIETRLWRWELRSDEPPIDGRYTTLKLGEPVALPAGGALLRADRVDFPPGGVAYTHTHQGPGIRVLRHGRFRVKTGGREIALAPGDPWFERGPDPVYARPKSQTYTVFIDALVTG